MFHTNVAAYAGDENWLDIDSGQYEESPVLTDAILKRLDVFVNNPVYLSNCLEQSVPTEFGSHAVISMLVAENDILREWVQEQDVVVTAARRYRQAEVAHRQNPSLGSAREQVQAQIALDDALAAIKY
jgi:hypothetical protein